MSWTTINLWLFNSKETGLTWLPDTSSHSILVVYLFAGPHENTLPPSTLGVFTPAAPLPSKDPPTLLWLPSLYLESFCINGTCWEQPFLTAPFKAFLYRSSKGAHTFTVKYQNPWWFYICSGVVTMFPVDCIVNQEKWLSWLFTGSVFHE